MNATKLVGLTTFLVIALPVTLWAEQSDVPDIPDIPAAVDEVVYAHLFALDEGYKFEWRKEQPLVKNGYILVLKVDRDLVYPRQTAEPVLYAGDQTAERVNVGYWSGRVVAIVPGKLDLKKTPIWFGTPELPDAAPPRQLRKKDAWPTKPASSRRPKLRSLPRARRAANR